MVQRDNPDLDDVFQEVLNGKEPTKPATKRRAGKRKARVGMTRDKVRRYAFRALALLADLDAPDRARVLKLACKLNRA